MSNNMNEVFEHETIELELGDINGASTVIDEMKKLHWAIKECKIQTEDLGFEPIDLIGHSYDEFSL
ncbi:hypothetical protein TVAG_388360 [Trichomonas vaginalis G3]|uniref:Uncharacterized protein n=1 Tax=Trichomonas vaginalis (strain ATCC PRA-98 / G3) TaxID=412133 RepID=A2DYH1_TRIV3|nr:hypothetical protein TVAGG3_0321330 [Trichomonas vaginalis G3]EAY14506.1 hypothetical protein TVAG_388360 [Trichomonas vaginalis G3]KAI5529321.1 hypothetical protein TVAGG3_0321330 [Trichomonas vaginalis G3]|eukprot:XP_001326729.1 hypothetical protein [Trichomonas vaginalis G3]